MYRIVLKLKIKVHTQNVKLDSKLIMKMIILPHLLYIYLYKKHSLSFISRISVPDSIFIPQGTIDFKNQSYKIILPYSTVVAKLL
jgi:hypothetical protein